jgi:hypothetical protein
LVTGLPTRALPAIEPNSGSLAISGLISARGAFAPGLARASPVQDEFAWAARSDRLAACSAGVFILGSEWARGCACPRRGRESSGPVLESGCWTAGAAARRR